VNLSPTTNVVKEASRRQYRRRAVIAHEASSRLNKATSRLNKASSRLDTLLDSLSFLFLILLQTTGEGFKP
jgi:division protein CdvB (Snf7/Vps24/ESCRT-III family)